MGSEQHRPTLKSTMLREIERERDKHFSRVDASSKKRDESDDELVRMTATTIGFVSEIIHYRKNRKHDQNQAVKLPKTSTEHSRSSIEAKDTSASSDDQGAMSKGQEDLTKAFLSRHPKPPIEKDPVDLQLPVVLPQRRPENRSRGFMRAYSPVLENHGISEEDFLDFVDTFNKILIPSAYIQTLNLADLVGTIIPEPALMLVGVAAGLIADAASEGQSRFRSNRFLDRANEDFFGPRGLMCLVVTWSTEGKGDRASHSAGVSIESARDTNDQSPCPAAGTSLKKLISSPSDRNRLIEQTQALMQSVKGQLSCTQCAPLVFSSIRTGTLSVNDTRRKKSAISRADDWVDNYIDQHGREKWKKDNVDHPVSALIPRPEYRSRYADPDHAAASSDFVGILTGGRWRYGSAEKMAEKVAKQGAQARKVAMKEEQAREKENREVTKKEAKLKTKLGQKTAEKSVEQDENVTCQSITEASGDETTTDEKEKLRSDSSLSKTLSSLLQKDVLYLVVVNKPRLDSVSR